MVDQNIQIKIRSDLKKHPKKLHINHLSSFDYINHEALNIEPSANNLLSLFFLIHSSKVEKLFHNQILTQSTKNFPRIDNSYGLKH